MTYGNYYNKRLFFCNCQSYGALEDLKKRINKSKLLATLKSLFDICR